MEFVIELDPTMSKIRAEVTVMILSTSLFIKFNNRLCSPPNISSANLYKSQKISGLFTMKSEFFDLLSSVLHAECRLSAPHFWFGNANLKCGFFEAIKPAENSQESDISSSDETQLSSKLFLLFSNSSLSFANQ